MDKPVSTPSSRMSDMLRRRFERELRRNANRRYVYSYRLKDGSLSDNLILVDYCCASDTFLRRQVMASLLPICDQHTRLAELFDVEVVEIGLFDKSTLRLNNHKSPVLKFSIREIVDSDDWKRLSGEYLEHLNGIEDCKK